MRRPARLFLRRSGLRIASLRVALTLPTGLPAGELKWRPARLFLRRSGLRIASLRVALTLPTGLPAGELKWRPARLLLRQSGSPARSPSFPYIVRSP
jgi:hypothetical protein